MSKTVDLKHEDAFAAANRFAENIVNVSSFLKEATTEDEAKMVIAVAQDLHLKLFDAFIAGVDYAREQSKE